MGFSNILALCGGLGLFLFGMKYMGAGLGIGCRSKAEQPAGETDTQPGYGLPSGRFLSPPACSPLLQRQSCVWAS